ncbi:hypothetical protein DSL72_003989 [Monilinia vaccinii-corymbosi]|uniref:Uncharacterized protein n=1 Tax=Monilinia vaccinii-corymbosi TaxID=61207 RepID=A0A8A3NUU8_9HELO|nr:hypothetical protein DSL72_003989 [Monilinia vaccinii-corymbosi]
MYTTSILTLLALTSSIIAAPLPPSHPSSLASDLDLRSSDNGIFSASENAGVSILERDDSGPNFLQDAKSGLNANGNGNSNTTGDGNTENRLGNGNSGNGIGNGNSNQGTQVSNSNNSNANSTTIGSGNSIFSISKKVRRHSGAADAAFDQSPTESHKNPPKLPSKVGPSPSPKPEPLVSTTSDFEADPEKQKQKRQLSLSELGNAIAQEVTSHIP